MRLSIAAGTRVVVCTVGCLLWVGPVRGGAEAVPVYPELASPFGLSRVFDYSEEQAELQRLNPSEVMAVLEDKDLAHATELGARHYRVRPGEYAGFAWDRMDPRGRGTDITFARTDALVTAAQRAGINVLPVLALHRDPAVDAEQGHRYLPADLEAYGAWVRAVVERYDGDGTDDMPGLRFRIGAWQVGETPDLLVGLSGGRYATVDQYVRVLGAAADAIRAAEPTARVVVGAISSADERDSGLDVLDGILASPAGAQVDVVAFEYLPRTLVSEELRKAVKAMRVRAGDRPLWCTLSCSYSRYTPRNAMRDREASELTQGADLVRRYTYMLANGVHRIYEAGITEQGPHQWKNRTFYSGLRDHDGAPKLAYTSYRLLVRLLGQVDYDSASVLSDGQNEVVVLQFPRRGSDALVYVLWWDYAATREYKLNALEADVATQVSLKLTDETVEIGEMVQNTIGQFNMAVVKPLNGELMVPIRRVPVLLRARASGRTAAAAPPGGGEES